MKINPRAIRVRLTFWYSLAFAISALVIFAAFFFITSKIPLTIIQKSLPSLLTALLIAFGILLVPAVWGGYLVAGGAMQPVSKLADSLKKLNLRNLKEQIPAPRTGDELDELAGGFNRLLARLNSSVKRERDFMNDVAHELKTPLATLSTNLELALAKKRTADEYRQVLTEALADSHRVSDVIKNILDLAWAESESGRQFWEEIDLSKMTEEILEIASQLSFRKKINVEGEIEPEIKVMGKPEKVYRAILNIVDNAVKYTPKNGKISIALRGWRGRAALEVKDTGIGISPKDLPNVFKRYYRGEQTGRKSGSGLGLAITRGIIKAHDGTVKIKSKLGTGTEVKIFLPKINKS